eukprot:TRINITY_DN35546_c0_g1_i3.p1 TRINITY_DN35546_c0_g1~~TRINITY_DN35546_c0_g1_i3.p1  ORF type:complete len:505 (-),score=61.66 TRINITY_DN35546_c0_g1_i3:621-2135(-)
MQNIRPTWPSSPPQSILRVPIGFATISSNTRPAKGRSVVAAERRGGAEQRRRLARRIAGAKSASAALAIAEESLSHFDHIHATACLQRVARLLRGNTIGDNAAILQGLLTLLQTFVCREDLDAPALAINAWSLAVLSSSSGDVLQQLWPRMVQSSMHVLDETSPMNLANLAWSSAVLRDLGSFRGDWLEQVACRVKRRAPECSPQGLANLCWAFGIAIVEGQPALHAAAVQAVLRHSELASRDLASVIWALAKSSTDATQRSLDLTATLCDEARAKIEIFEPRHISNIAWALATLQASCCAGHRTGPFFSAIMEDACRRPSAFAPQDLAPLFWALAATTFGETTSIKPMIMQVRAKRHQFEKSGLVNIVWAFAVLTAGANLVGSLVVGAVHPRKGTSCLASPGCNLDAQQLARVAWALAKTRSRDAPLQDMIFSIVSSKAELLDPQDLANLGWAAAIALVSHSATLVKIIGNQALRQLPQLTGRHLASVAWSLAAANQYDSSRP